jgi:hypothetical protein
LSSPAGPTPVSRGPDAGGSKARATPSLLLDEELAHAVRTEAAAVRYWWGVSHGVVEGRRKYLAVTRTNNPGTHRLVQAIA